MTLKELDRYFRDFLNPEEYSADPSMNGIQIENSDVEGKPIKKIAYAVDACHQTVMEAARQKADMIFVHHGLFWGDCEPIVGHVYKRISSFIKNDIALYAMHIPLDINNPYGNNYGLAARINLQKIQPFGEWRGMKIGVKGELPEPLTSDELARKILLPNEKPLAVLPFGKKEIKSVGIISGGAAHDVAQAIQEELDAYVTGEIEHSLYHFVKESGINMIAGGHYQTETVGVNLVRQKVEKELGIEGIFIDFPTNL